MNRREAAQVLARAASAGLVSKPANDAEAQLMAQTWADALLPAVTLAAADGIVVQIAGEDRDRHWITPGDVNTRWKREREREQTRQQSQRMIADLAETSGAPMPDELRDLFYRPPNPALEHPCPWCRSSPGEPCTSLGRALTDAHPSRVELAERGAS